MAKRVYIKDGASVQYLQKGTDWFVKRSYSAYHPLGANPEDYDLIELENLIKSGHMKPLKLVDMDRHSLRMLYGENAPSVMATHVDNMSANVHRCSSYYTHTNYPREFLNWKTQAKELGKLVTEFHKVANDNGRTRGEVQDELEILKDALDNAPSCLITAVCGATEKVSDNCGRWVQHLTHCSCGHVEYADDTGTLENGDVWCSNCFEDAVEVDGEYYDRDSVYYWESDGEYHLEGEPEDDDDYYNAKSHRDVQSWSTRTSSLDHDKSFTPTPLGDFTIGVELETESTHQDFNDAVEDTLWHFNAGSYPRYIMLKEDGSLSSNGFEIVTAARKLTDHIARFKTWVPHSSLRAWAPGNCGVHTHIDSRAFTALGLGKFIMFINDSGNYNLIKKIAGRHPLDGGKAQTYCAAEGQDVLESPSKALKGANYNRYRMVNTCTLTEREACRLKVSNHERNAKGDYSTVELRIFRASLKKERLLAQIEFAHAAVMFTRVSSYHDLTETGFRAWLTKSARLYKNLARWLGINVPKPDMRSGKTAPEEINEAVSA